MIDSNRELIKSELELMGITPTEEAIEYIESAMASCGISINAVLHALSGLQSDEWCYIGGKLFQDSIRDLSTIAEELTKHAKRVEVENGPQKNLSPRDFGMRHYGWKGNGNGRRNRRK